MTDGTCDHLLYSESFGLDYALPCARPADHDGHCWPIPLMCDPPADDWRPAELLDTHPAPPAEPAPLVDVEVVEP